MSSVIVFDIETIPQQTPLSPTQKNQLNKKLNREFPEGKPQRYDKKVDNFDLDLPKFETDEYIKYRKALKLKMATSPFLGTIVCIGLLKVTENKFKPGEIKKEEIKLTGTEEGIVRKFWEYIEGFRGDFVSYNGLGFDIPWIVKKSMKYGIRSSNDRFLSTKRFQRFPHFDCMMILADWDNREKVSLDEACDMFSIPTPKGGKIEGASVEKAFKEGNIQGIVDYCIKDIHATYALYSLLRDY